MKMDTTSEISAVSIDSVKNCEMICLLLAPFTFLMPISFALLSDLAMERLV